MWPDLKSHSRRQVMKCHRGIKVLALAAAGFAFSVSAGAQSTTSTTDPTVGQRKENQQDRVANGVQNGSLTPGETTSLEGKEANLNKETRQCAPRTTAT